MKKIMISDKMEKTIRHIDNEAMENEGMKKVLRAIYIAISLLEHMDSTSDLNNVKKIVGENMYVLKVDSKLRMVFTESEMEDGTRTYIILDVFKYDDYRKFLENKGTVNDLMS